MQSCAVLCSTVQRHVVTRLLCMPPQAKRQVGLTCEGVKCLLAFWRGHRALLPSADLHRTNWLCSERRRSGSSGMANQRLAAAAGFVQAHRWPACQPSNADNALQAAQGSLPGGPPQQLHTADRVRTLGLAIVLVVGVRRGEHTARTGKAQHKNRLQPAAATPLAPCGRPERRLRNCLALVQAAPAIPQINGFRLLFWPTLHPVPACTCNPSLKPA
jgi:hypothetical protein